MIVRNETEIQLLKILFKNNGKVTKNLVSKNAYPHGVEQKFYRKLKSIFKPLTDYVNKYLDENMTALMRGDSLVINLDAIPGRTFRNMIANLENWLSIYMPDIKDSKSKNVIYMSLNETADEAKEFGEKEFEKMLKKGINVELPLSSDWWGDMKNSWADDNYTLITSNAKNYVSKINTLTEQAIVNGLSPKQLMEDIKKATEGLSDKHCRLLARDQIGKLNGQITQAQMQEIGLSMYIWDSSGDERVRASHALMDGLLCRWDDASLCSYDGGKTWEKRPAGAVELHPGQDIQCRCVASSYYPELISEVENIPIEVSTNEISSDQNILFSDLSDEQKKLYNSIYDELNKLEKDKNKTIGVSYACVTGDFSKVPESLFKMTDTNWLNFENKIKKALELYDTRNMTINEFEIARDLFSKGKKLPKFTCTQKELQDYIAYLKGGEILGSYEKMFSGKYSYEKYLAFAKELGNTVAGQNSYCRGLLEYLNLNSKELEKITFTQFSSINRQYTFSDIKSMKYFDDCLSRANIKLDIGKFNFYDFVKIEPEEGVAWGTADLLNPNYKSIAMFDHKITPFDKSTQKLIDVEKITIDTATARAGIAHKLYCEQFYPLSKKLTPSTIKYDGKTYKYHNDEFLRLEFSYDKKKKDYKVGQVLKQTGVFATTPSELHNSIWYKDKTSKGAEYPVRFHLKRNELSQKYLSAVQIDDLKRGVYTSNNPEEFDFAIGQVKVKKVYDGYINGDKSMPVLEVDVEIVE